MNEAANKIEQLLFTYFRKEEADKIADILYSQIEIIENIYFELGIFAGLKIATDYYEKIKELI